MSRSKPTVLIFDPQRSPLERPSELRAARLGPRQQEVLSYLGEGHSVSEIATILGLSVKTVSTYRCQLLEKLGVFTTAALIRYAILESERRNEDTPWIKVARQLEVLDPGRAGIMQEMIERRLDTLNREAAALGVRRDAEDFRTAFVNLNDAIDDARQAKVLTAEQLKKS